VAFQEQVALQAEGLWVQKILDPEETEAAFGQHLVFHPVLEGFPVCPFRSSEVPLEALRALVVEEALEALAVLVLVVEVEEVTVF